MSMNAESKIQDAIDADIGSLEKGNKMKKEFPPVEFPPAPCCATCGGKCCKRYAGCCFPSDFDKPLAESLKAALQSGKYVVDCWEGDIHEGGNRVEVYFIRPAHTNSNRVVDRSWGGKCVFLTPTGCSLPWEDRPTGCKLMEPLPDEKCRSHYIYPQAEGYAKLDAAYAWDEYQGMIATILTDLED